MADVTAVILAGGGNTNPLARFRCMPAVEIGKGERERGRGEGENRLRQSAAAGGAARRGEEWRVPPRDTLRTPRTPPARALSPAWVDRLAAEPHPGWGFEAGNGAEVAPAMPGT